MSGYKVQHTIELIFALVGSIVFSLACFGMQAFAFFNQANVQPSSATPECQILPSPAENTVDSNLLSEIQAIVQAIADRPSCSEGLSNATPIDAVFISPALVFIHRFAPGALF